jgi:hypothetical protein
LELVQRFVEVIAHPNLPFDASELALTFLLCGFRSSEPHKWAVIFHDHNVFSTKGAFEELVEPAAGLSDVNLGHINARDLFSYP